MERILYHYVEKSAKYTEQSVTYDADAHDWES